MRATLTFDGTVAVFIAQAENEGEQRLLGALQARGEELKASVHVEHEGHPSNGRVRLCALGLYIPLPGPKDL